MAEPLSDEPIPATDPAAVGLGDSTSIRIGAVDREALDGLIGEVFDTYQAAMKQRYQRWREIDEAYQQVPNPKRSGVRPDSSRLVSEVMRSFVNITTSWLVDALLSFEPMLEMTAIMESTDESPEVQQAIERSKRFEEFLEYVLKAMRFDEFVELWIRDAVKKGTSIAYTEWEETETVHQTKSAKGKVTKSTENNGGETCYLLRCEDMLVWPLTETDYRKLDILGHCSSLREHEYNALCRELGVPADGAPGTPGPAASHESFISLKSALAGKDIKPLEPTRLPSTRRIAELWCNLPMTPDGERQKFVSVYDLENRRSLKIVEWPRNSGDSPYTPLHYLREGDCFWGTGEGQELLFSQAAEDVITNLLVDNLKIVGNFMVAYKTGSPAELLQDQIGPGAHIPVDDKDDLQTVQLGGDLSGIMQALQWFEQVSHRATNLGYTISGQADPTLKSGATPGAYSQLTEGAGRKFKLVDRNIRYAVTDFAFKCLEDIQQYASTGYFYLRLPQESAEFISRIKFDEFLGDLRRNFNLRVRAPHTTSNREVARSNMLAVFQLAQQAFPPLIQLGALIFQQNPVRQQMLQEQFMNHSLALYRSIVQSMDVPGLLMHTPKPFEPTPADQLIESLVAQMQQVQAENEQLKQGIASVAGVFEQGAQGAGMAAPQGQPGSQGFVGQ